MYECFRHTCCCSSFPGLDKLVEGTAFSTSLIVECVLDFVKKVLMGGLYRAICVHPGEEVTIVLGRCVIAMGLRGAGAWRTLSTRSHAAALTVCLNSLSHQGEGRKPLVSGLMRRVPAWFAMSPTQ
jgi:hypothetical protein